MKIHEKIELIRQRKGVTKTHIANKCNKTSAWYTGISKGRSKIDVETLQQIAEALEVDVRIFFEDNLSVTLNSEKQII
ncbi:helix-turn-helix domain-containing protein [Virgibacillus sediminis]|uniref:Helix-turn-helix domain-containing protein n=1 Tax=Virgibacillus sediminis TaxID=202260 RepID=A0ABV7A6X9_9BACI